jgi:hypothetical protein
MKKIEDEKKQKEVKDYVSQYIMDDSDSEMDDEISDSTNKNIIVEPSMPECLNKYRIQIIFDYENEIII